MANIKSYNGLYDKMLTDDNIWVAIMNSSKNKRKKNKRHKELRYMRHHAEECIPYVRQWIENFEPAKHRPVTINDGISAKKREIIVPTIREIVVQNAMVEVMKPIFMHGMYEHSYASIPKRGLHGAVKVVRRWIKNDHANTKYCLKLDIRKFFDSVDQNVLLLKLRKLIRDNRFYDLLEKVVRTTSDGIPLGFTTSQWFANFLLTELDHKIKEEYHVKYYVRFMDDMILFGSNKRELHRVRKKIAEYLETELHLQLKENWQVFLMDNLRTKKKGRFLDFLGFKFYRTHIGLRSKLALRMQRKAKRIYRKGNANVRDARQIVIYAGLAKYANCRAWFREHVTKYVCIRNMRKIISRYDRSRSFA